MIVFNHNIFFKNEKQLQENIKKDSLNTVWVLEKSDSTLLNTFSLKTIWALMSGQQVRYLSRKLFNEVNRDISWAFEIKDIVTLVWNAKKREIIYTKGENYTPELLRFWIFHTFFPVVLELERTYRILHVGAVEIEE